ncbi:NADH-dependent [FeFe] hydrogenase, group A6 [Clostridium saccharoperbutylacetonicum]|uniref:NADH-dependent [FeFe] hydrogenase, group A6 n=1 Tax=Clostridium saccharoperbutylacetonicum TaxID=36745 RepID=UPI000983C958|nr:NADH-dependent [FeFe] hydrogenase, group A6 [Clostridium saccharoperbutylacetonicum]AQR95758.1 NADP-reducing hydrogenase subunit HndC [Clostridium saccharoperbutylacetonicum]NSB31621.1 NADH-quinone oxidoreductase subunit G [Clostridium saccharoperbutylacetonicum]
MVNLKIDNITVEVNEGTTILEAAKLAGIPIPSLCYLKGINEIGACRVCVVEVKGKDKLLPACNNMVESGMEILTNSPRVRETRRTNVELILSQHDCNCAFCVRSGNCNLQTISNDLGILSLSYDKNVEPYIWNESFPLIRDAGKCIKCMRCIQICNKIQSLNIWDVANTGSRTTVDVSYNRRIKNSDCSLCGQCITHCPVGALRERDDTVKAFSALADPDKITVVQIAPAVRAAWGEALGLTREEATVNRLVSALRRMGFNYIFDTNFSADLTIMEEGNEFIERISNKENNIFPMFTSCCPGWVRFLKSQYPDMVEQLSTAKSPQQMFGAVAKSYYAKILNVDPSKIFSISVMPCVAKKHEAEIPVMNDAGAGQDVDLVLTTREIERMIRAEHIICKDLKEEEFDMPLGVSSGAGVIFGSTGGVMEAALRSAHFIITGKNPDPDAFKEVRISGGIKEAVFEIAGSSIKVAVVSGLGNARKLVKAIRKGKAHYDFVEVMACPGGCSGGGGQPIADGLELGKERADNLYKLDKKAELRFSHENPSIIQLYADYMEKPLSHKAHKLLHTDHNAWIMPLSPRKDFGDNDNE